jgi:integrase
VPLTLLVATGCRRPKLLAITWDPIDDRKGTLTIDRNLHRVLNGRGGRDLRMNAAEDRRQPEGHAAGSGPRTPEGPPEDQASRALALGSGWFQDDELVGLVCDRGDGGPIDPDNLSTAFRRFA